MGSSRLWIGIQDLMQHHIAFLRWHLGSADLITPLILLVDDDHALLEDDISTSDHSFKVIFTDVWKPLSVITEVLVDLLGLFGSGVV